MATKTKKKTATKQAQNEAPAEAVNGMDNAQANQPEQLLSIGDLKILATVIDVASTRGAFRANEMAMVGMVYNKLQAFLAKVAPAEDKKPADATDEKKEESK